MKPQPAVFQITDRWRLSEDGALQWLLQYREGERWKNKAYCGTKAGLLEVAIPHNKVTAVGGVLAALNRLPDSYEPGALERLAGEMLDRAA